MLADRREGVGGFPTTHWSLVVRAGRDHDTAKREALGELLTRYLPALRAHLVFGKRLTPDDADDVLQDFLACKVLEKDLLSRADPAVGRFRTYLLTTLDRFFLNRIRDAAAKKRSPGAKRLVEIGDRDDLLPAPQEPTDEFDKAWAGSVIREALDHMRQACQAEGRERIWELFHGRVVAPALEGAEPVDYRQLVDRFGFRSPAEASNALVNAKRMYVRALRSVIAEYASDAVEIESEIRQLQGILAGSSR